jgi:hypothetical protein
MLIICKSLKTTRNAARKYKAKGKFQKKEPVKSSGYRKPFYTKG